MLFHVSTLLALAAGCLNAVAVPAPPPLTYLYTINITAGAGADIGFTPVGHRSGFTYAGGNFSGPSLNGESLLVPYNVPWPFWPQLSGWGSWRGLRNIGHTLLFSWGGSPQKPPVSLRSGVGLVERNGEAVRGCWPGPVRHRGERYMCLR